MNGASLEMAGKIGLTLPKGQVLDAVMSMNEGWEWSHVKGEEPQKIHLSEAQVQMFAAPVEAVVTALTQK